MSLLMGGGTVEDRVAIEELIHRYARAIDSRDRELLCSCFTEDVFISYDGRHVVEGIAQLRDGERSSGTFVDLEVDRYQHVMTPLVIEIDGDSATASTYCLAHLVGTRNGVALVVTRGLRYDDELEKSAGEWRIRRRLHQCLWMHEQPSLPT